jgi:hypothetical protein
LCFPLPQILAQGLGQPLLAFFILAHDGEIVRTGPVPQPALTRADAFSIAPPLARPHPLLCCRSSVVERILGKAEVVSSILTGSTISPE